MTVAVCLKWVAPPDRSDDRFAGISPADRSALELALQSAEPDEEVVAVSAGPAGAERALRDALALGAAAAVRIDLPRDAASSSVADALAEVVRGSRLVWCGDYSLDRGTGSVPAFVAARLGIAQALGLVSIERSGRTIRAIRRLDGARREVLRIDGPAVLSVEGSTARLRRASVRALLAAEDADIRVVAGRATIASPVEERPYRPRARVLAAPTERSALDRVKRLTDSTSPPRRAETVVLEPAAAAERIVAALREWGYLA